MAMAAMSEPKANATKVAKPLCLTTTTLYADVTCSRASGASATSSGPGGIFYRNW